ncbi:hypothetical protein [uncultured Gammaproteobacteria bacterium]|uniref:PP0621 family protein n=1 Tax=Bathymodiolus heckerae thiotrophic gill symbiont TaxID=1052212 RepID=UPI0010BB6D9B|nr:PP0621 family protein [Bathymodiolus heckerae thiotrophic gill symbiont]CAC9579614.1 hypothetical protein [uncultured Gammaproteobacteria bacterium]CAC9607576.1 hypothetical protein [uncultured Gammaproteobacteria bacterium]CAC9958474.1 hypothetical protein [uncultured Gammaproteobacteria bacterium]SHN89476.1 hypothetical protein BHECKSOX_1784 [Bathymodiolus heckerae thiotrophic gill symbiont]
MIKLIIIFLIAWLGFSVWRKLRQPKSNDIPLPSTRKMLSCSICKTHIPENEAIIHDGKAFCSKKCLG